ncbi:DNA-processing protein DprA [Rhodobacter capsulatus]|uniref:DNA processing protein n=1 Tax=Rhodobacter capsulatus TaxID=1061 RepID=A0A1G7C658_RHOCA|nr:DNA-processing protein DprA [Rhodobacter capsulatus]WER08922.1 DNA-processing protein DprA [Rhodobacter capsulatus]SDE34777.1 DNA processing protein [Rhodobacter capsulatus]
MKTSLFSYPTPFTPPTTEEDELSFLRLARSRRVGATTFHRLLKDHGSAAAALDALPGIARAAGSSDYSPCPPGVAEAERAAGRRAGARLLLPGGPGYPADLLDFPDAPPLLWARGRVDLLARPRVAVIGARNASSLGQRMARKLAEEMGRAGFAVVSGLARGIDAAAHDAALPTGTIAVMAGGIEVIYPPENRDLAGRIAAEGLLLSELPPGTEPQARHFPQRNRIIAALSRATLVVEAAARSGSLLTARMALDYGREVMAVPGHPMDARAAGCNMLIRDGAVLIRGAEDVIEAMGLAAAPRPDPRPPSQPDTPPQPAAEKTVAKTVAKAAGTGLRARLLALLGPAPTPEDTVIRDLGIDAATLSREVIGLEIEGEITRHPGGLLSRG